MASNRGISLRVKLRYWLTPRRLASGVRVRQHTWVQWLGRRWFVRFIEDEATYLNRKRRYEAWKASGFTEFPS